MNQKPKQFISFLIAGGTAAVVNFGSRLFFSIWFSYSVAIILAYICGMITAFFLNRAFVFTKSTTTFGRAAIGFGFVNILAVAQTWGISLLFAKMILPWFGVTTYIEEIAHAVGITVPVVVSYFGHKHITFRERDIG